MMDFMGVPMVLGFVILVLLIAAVAAAAYLGLRALGRGGGDDSARGLLDRRLASGEIDAEEYYEREAALRSASAPPRGARRRGR